MFVNIIHSFFQIYESCKIKLDSTNSYDFKHSGEVFKNFSSPPLIKTRGLLMVGVYIILTIFAIEKKGGL